MQNNKIKKLIREAVLDLLNNTISEKKISQIISKHRLKVHFVPIRYRIFGGLLQSLNIQFGNFIEVLMSKIVEDENDLEIIKEISGKKNVPLPLTEKTDTLIDRFITDRQNSTDNKLAEKFEKLLKDIVDLQSGTDSLTTTKHDVDVLFRDKRDGNLYYLETKYNDDHDTGKYADINRKFIKTYAGLIKILGIKNTRSLKPILYYLTKKIMKGNIYVPEGKYIYRGDKLFAEFFTIDYSDLDNYLKNISEDEEVLKIFDNLYKKIRFGK